jgi:leucyl/phenylalanyl-tRNA--protein transferase
VASAGVARGDSLGPVPRVTLAGRALGLGRFTVSFNQAFGRVVDARAERPGETWITGKIRDAYVALHEQGHTGSVEVWLNERLAGGVYGVHIGGAFFAESKFHRVRDMSKVALTHLLFRLRERGFSLLEVQYLTRHLAQFGVVQIEHYDYLRLLRAAIRRQCRFN